MTEDQKQFIRDYLANKSDAGKVLAYQLSVFLKEKSYPDNIISELLNFLLGKEEAPADCMFRKYFELLMEGHLDGNECYPTSPFNADYCSTNSAELLAYKKSFREACLVLLAESK